ncbi:acetyltransferase [Faecalibacter sp. LW9]|uniref:acetyltransferase n=1 Tax=Faecalibacter sp. LW9 TaxID=3103144 RepID=UPI002AFEA00C|nr:acetyltransferase [Faecalibacter sp. LW9]
MYLYGASGHGKVIVEIAEELGYGIDGFIDNNAELDSIFDYPVIHQTPASGEVFLSMGNNATRQRIAKAYPQFTYPTLIHPKAIVSKRAKLGEGTVVMAGVTINSEVQIGKQCIINTSATLDHECRIGDFAHISPHVGLAGNVTVGEGTQVGIGACVIQGITIGKWCMIGAGAVVIRDVPDYAVVVGNPGRIIKYNRL